ncbi:Uncharacterised protein [Actinobacillus equuli]|nr:Uncharacterised protein [Actinobacillus equuli]
MAGRTNTGVANHISNPIVMFPKNAITIDILEIHFTENMNLVQEMILAFIGIRKQVIPKM